MQVKRCEICGKRAARYVCQECGREVCETCLEPHTWVCSDCYGRVRREAPPFKVMPWSTPFKLFLLGFLMILIGMIIMMIAAVFFGASTGAMIWIIPFPPVMVGAGPHLYPLWAVMLAVAVTILGVILFLVLRKQA